MLRIVTVVVAAPVLVLLGACGSTDRVDPVPESTVRAAPAASTASPVAPPTAVPDDVRLAHEGRWTPTLTGPGWSPLPGTCVDPPPRLADVEPTDGVGVHDGEYPHSRSEALGVYVDPRDAAEAVTDWRSETALCGAHGPQSHTGEPVEWFVVAGSVDGADEVWHAYELSDEVDGRDLSGTDPFVTVVRVGNAVHVETSYRPGQLDPAALEEAVAAGTAAAARVVPVLAPFAG